jgi:hypothetical protein
MQHKQLGPISSSHKWDVNSCFTTPVYISLNKDYRQPSIPLRKLGDMTTYSDEAENADSEPGETCREIDKKEIHGTKLLAS